MDMTPPPEGTLETLFQISDTVRAGLAELRRDLRKINADALEERLGILEPARDRVRALAKAHSLEVGDVRERIERCVSDVDEAYHYARTALQRKRRWETSIEPHVKTIKASAARSRELRTGFFETKRALDAEGVAALKSEVESLHRASLEAWNLLQIEDIPGGLRGRLKRDVGLVGSFLSETQRSVEVKEQWEAGQASNAMALEQLVSEIEAFARGGGAPKDVSKRVKRAVGELDRRRPLDRELKGVFEQRLKAVGEGASSAIEEARVAHRERVLRARERFKRIIGELEALIGPRPPKGPKTVDKKGAAGGDTLPQAEPEAAPEPAEKTVAEAAPEPMEETDPEAAPEPAEKTVPEATSAIEARDVSTPQGGEPAVPSSPPERLAELLLGELGSSIEDPATKAKAKQALQGAVGVPNGQSQRVAEVKAEAPPLPALTPKEAARASALEKELKEGLRLAPLGKGELRRLKGETAWIGKRMKAVRKMALAHHTAKVEADVTRVLERAKSGPLKGVLNEIQSLQRSMNKAPIPWKLKDVHRATLREAWSLATARIEGAKQRRESREVGRLKGLARHLERWESRIEGLNRLIPKTEERLEFQERRGEFSTSIGGKLLAVKNRAKLEERIKGLRETREELLKKVADVRPMLEAAGYPWPEDPEEEDTDGADGSNPKVQGTSKGEGPRSRGRRSRPKSGASTGAEGSSQGEGDSSGGEPQGPREGEVPKAEASLSPEVGPSAPDVRESSPEQGGGVPGSSPLEVADGTVQGVSQPGPDLKDGQVDGQPTLEGGAPPEGQAGEGEPEERPS